MKIDPVQVEAIQKLFIPRSKMDIQSFLGKINFVRRFIPIFSELVKQITSMLRKEAEIKWIEQARNSFESIKKAIMEAPTLISPDYTKRFYIFSFASYDTLVVVLLQKHEERLDKINFVRRFIPNFSELAKHITSMLRKEAEIKWTENERNSFEAIKKAIMEAPTLISP